MNTTDEHIIAALRGEPAPTREKVTPTGPMAAYYPLIRESLTEAARQYMVERQIKDGASPFDTYWLAEIQVDHEYEAAIKAGADPTEALHEAAKAIERRVAYYRGRTSLTGNRAAAEAASGGYTPSILRNIQEG